MVSTYAYPNFKLSNAILLLAKLLLESSSESWDCVWKLPPLPYPSWQMRQIKA